ncbi:hypothetical protein G6O69_08195 [Pseudenhygromyxa sp. WMMC2535]|uniref:hypothetical protein n=1 Tax=Pseudenhygromyxa sp. WMMC2535 TaxID=2712867 RepID=UPI0015561B65|nr:hypothetical protein [Pseudenhygromyxa sp. WMMC2535]NVB37811.1 hypothetical protein [Pseudenhygromyxa sp. WMMC2535]
MTTPRPDANDTAQRLRDVYITLGSIIADTRSLPLRRYASEEISLHLESIQRHMLEAEHELRALAELLDRPLLELPETEPETSPGPFVSVLASRELPELHALRAQLAELILAHGGSVPDDLPDGPESEYQDAPGIAPKLRLLLIAFAIGAMLSVAILALVLE